MKLGLIRYLTCRPAVRIYVAFGAVVSSALILFILFKTNRELQRTPRPYGLFVNAIDEVVGRSLTHLEYKDAKHLRRYPTASELADLIEQEQDEMLGVPRLTVEEKMAQARNELRRQKVDSQDLLFGTDPANEPLDYKDAMRLTTRRLFWESEEVSSERKAIILSYLRANATRPALEGEERAHQVSDITGLPAPVALKYPDRSLDLVYLMGWRNELTRNDTSYLGQLSQMGITPSGSKPGGHVRMAWIANRSPWPYEPPATSSLSARFFLAIGIAIVCLTACLKILLVAPVNPSQAGDAERKSQP